eukprot:CAMPEP_0197278328 /NCGR_PEP_ID=MMETSP1432-20130617/18490_1 /TAXON_ID=44447 /ORGANISM="Pseudo-nitzschia delicatissima, Strain UNC1205" /LENGTH=481 /DNA_ID=CAMNT_0042744683 /DNA_START=13 /DNA_END=1458 /DNA_ORIENTATION=+
MTEITNSVADSSLSSSSDDLNTSISLPSPSTEHKTKSPSPASVLSQSPASIQKVRPISSVRIDFLTRSTIYKRHEARLARSYALRDDPRPVIIRVLSGLPGLQAIFPPYRSESEKFFDRLNEQNQQGKISTTKVVNGAYSEETLFNRYSEVTDNATEPEATEKDTTTGYTFAPESIVQAMLATGFCSGSAEFIYAYAGSGNLNHATSSSTSPFHNTADSMTKNSRTSSHHWPLFFRSNVAGPEIYNGFAREIPNAANNNTFFETTNNAKPSTAGAFSKAFSAAIPISVLFGAKVFLDSILEDHENGNASKHKVSPLVAYSILSSAFAGGVVGSSRLVFEQVKYRQQSQPSSLSMIDQQRLASGYSFNLIGRNIAAAVLYFSVYEGVSSMSSASSRTHLDAGALSSTIQSDRSGTTKGIMDIVVGGALAGVAHTAAMHSHRYGHYGSMIWWSRIMLPALSRAAPIHALVFYGYERMKEGVEA